MAQYSKQLPFDTAGTPLQNHSSPYKALEQNGGFAAVSSVITLTADTTVLEVGASGGAGIVMRWVPSTETAGVSPFGSVIGTGATANWDNFVPADTYRRFVVPIEKANPAPSIQGANATYGLYSRVAFIAVGTPTSSVLASEF